MERIKLKVLYPDKDTHTTTLQVTQGTKHTKHLIEDCLNWGTTLAPEPSEFDKSPSISDLYTIRRALQHALGTEDVSDFLHIGRKNHAVALKPEAVDALLKSDWASIEGEELTITIPLKDLDEEIAWNIEDKKSRLNPKNYASEDELEKMATVDYLNNFCTRFFGNHRNRKLESRESETETNGERYDRGSYHKDGLSELYLRQTLEEFYAEIDKALLEAGTSFDELKENMGPSDPVYCNNIDKVLKAYKILRKKGYSYRDLAA